MARGFRAGETASTLKAESISSAGANAAKVFEYVRSEYAKLPPGGFSGGTPEFARSGELSKMREKAERELVRAVAAEFKKVEKESAPSEAERIKAINNKLTPEEEKEYRRKYGEAGDGRVGNGVLRSDGKIELRDSDVAFILQNGEDFDYLHPDGLKSLLYEGSDDATEIATLALRGLARDSSKRVDIEFEGSMTVSGIDDDESAPEITSASFYEDDVIEQFEKIGVVITPSQATTIVTYIEKAYEGKSRDLTNEEVKRIKIQRADERADEIIRNRKYGPDS